jgi:hypothetical protein
LPRFCGSTITSDAGLLTYRKLDDTSRLTDTDADMPADARAGKNGRHRLARLFRRACELVHTRRPGFRILSSCPMWERAMPITVIKIINESTDVADADLQSWVNAIQQQIREHVAPLWLGNRNVTLQLVPRGQEVPQDTDTGQVVLRDDTDQPPNLGYHSPSTSSSGPIAMVFTRTTRNDFQTVSGAMSHEIIEMLVDPTDTLKKQEIDGVTYLIEACDPVHSDQYGYDILGVRVSNFVTQDYYRYTTGNKFDYLGLLKGPCPAVLPGCVVYAIDANNQPRAVS